jgi:hypothetical protein
MESDIELWTKSMNAGLGIRVTLNTHSLSRPLACARIGLGTLTADRQAPEVPLTSIGFDGLETLQVNTQLTAQVTLNDVLSVLDRLDDLGQLLLR